MRVNTATVSSNNYPNYFEHVLKQVSRVSSGRQLLQHGSHGHEDTGLLGDATGAGALTYVFNFEKINKYLHQKCEHILYTALCAANAPAGTFLG